MKFNQYYYTAAPNLFNQNSKLGWGIFGSSTPNDAGKNDWAEQISKGWVPMPLLEEDAFPMEYVMYVDDRYVAGGTTSCNALIHGDNRPNIWTHVIVPEEKGTKSFLSCLQITSFDKVKKHEDPIVLKPIIMDKKWIDFRKDLKTWSSQKKDAALLKRLLLGLSGGEKRILITDEELKEDDFSAYQDLARSMMKHIYSLLPGSLRKELNFIAPMVAKYFRLSSEKPKGGRFYFGPRDEYDVVISMQEGEELSNDSFYSGALIQMMELYHENNDLYEEIGSYFKKNIYMFHANDYIWHFVYEMLERGITFDWSFFGQKEYLDAYWQAENDQRKQSQFLKLTSILRKKKTESFLSEANFSVFCRSMRSFDKKTEHQIVSEAVEWILQTELYDPDKQKEFLQILLKTNAKKEIIYAVQNDVMKKSTGLWKEAKKELEHVSTSMELKKWWSNYEPMKERFLEDLADKIEVLFMALPDFEERKRMLAMDQEILEKKICKKLKNRLLLELPTISFENPHAWEVWIEKKDDLKLLDEEIYEKKQKSWVKEFWRQVKEEDILLNVSWRNQIRAVAEELDVDWKNVCDYFSTVKSKLSFDWGKAEIEASRKIAEHLESSIAGVLREICDDAEERIRREERNQRFAQIKGYDDHKLLKYLTSAKNSAEREFAFRTVSFRILQWDHLKNEIQFQLLLCYVENHSTSDQMKDKFWELCTIKWFSLLFGKLNHKIEDNILLPCKRTNQIKFLIYKDVKRPFDKKTKQRILENAKKLSVDERKDFAKWLQYEMGNSARTDYVVELLVRDESKKISEYLNMIMISIFWVSLNLIVYEGILKIKKYGSLLSVAAWGCIIVLSLILLILAFRSKKRIPEMTIVLFGSFFWISCAAIMKIFFGLMGEILYLCGLSFVMLMINRINKNS